MKKIVFILFLAILIFVGFKLVKEKKEIQANQPTAFIAKKLVKKSEPTQIEEKFEYFQAKVEALQNPKITTKISGYIKDIKVKENQEVKQGDILVQIDDKEYQESLKQLDYSLQAITANINSLKLSLESLHLDSNLAKTQYETNQKLYAIGGIAKEKLELSAVIYKQKESKYKSTQESIKAKEYEYQSAKATLNSKKALQNYYALKAPMSGKVEKIILDIGDITNPNQAIVTLVSHEQKLTFLFASESIKPLQEVYVEDMKIGFIEYINPSSENFLHVANVALSKKLQNANNSLIAIKVKVK